MGRLFAAIAVATLSACAPGAGDAPNVLLITVDTLRPDRLSVYGYAKHATPNIDRLAAEGMLFENAFTDTPWTTPSMSSVLTGTYPTRHGFKSTNAHRLALEQVTLAEILSERGYDTAAVIGSFPLDAIYRLDQGFAHYDDHFTRPIWNYPDHEPTPLESEFREDPHEQAMFAMVKAMSDSRRTDEEVTSAALRWLAGEHGEPFFLWVHYFGPHSKPDWSVPEDERLARQLAQYDPDVRTNDREVGRLLAALDAAGLADDTLVIFHSDHGESLGEQRYVGHGVLLNDASMRIPLVLRLPGRIAPGTRSRTLARNVDILATVLDAVGAPIPEQSNGRSLLSELAPGAAEPVAYMETYYPAHEGFAKPVVLPDGSQRKIGLIHRSVRSGRWQLIRSEPYPLFDVADETWSDLPIELLHAMWREVLVDALDESENPPDLAQQKPELTAQLRGLLDAHLEQEERLAPSIALDEESRLRLESLGYGD